MCILKGQCHESFCFCFFFHESVSPQPQSIPLGPFRIFKKFAEIFASQGAPPVSTTPVANLPLVSMTPAAKVPPVSTTPAAICHRYQLHRRQILPPVASVVDTGGK